MMKAYVGIVIVFIIAIGKQIDADVIQLRDVISNQLPSIVSESIILRNRRENSYQYSTESSESENRTVVFDQQNDCKTPTIRKMRQKRELFFGVLLPSNMPDRGGSPAVLPAMELAVNKIKASGGILEGWDITMEYRDTQCSSVYGPLAAFELYTKQKPGLYSKNS